MAYVIEMPAAFLCVLPSAGSVVLDTLRRAGAILQAAFQVAILLTGNYGFFNMLTLALCVPMLHTSRASAGPARPRQRLLVQGATVGGLAAALAAVGMLAFGPRLQVRETPCRPRSWATFSLL